MGRWTRIVRLVLPLAFVACVDFDGQTMTYRYDAKNDRLLVFQVYEGIHTTGDGEVGASQPAKAKTAKKPAVSPTAKEIEQLDSVVNGQRTFFFGNWITEYNRADVEKAIAETNAGAASRPAAASQPSPAEKRARSEVALFEQLLASVKVANGKFFLNGAGQLGAYQQMTVDQVSRVIERANTAISAMLAADDLDEFSPAERDKLRAFAAGKGRWVELNGNELRFRFWDRYDKFIEFREDLLKQFVRGQIIVNYNQPLVEVIIGRPENPFTELTAPASSIPDRQLIDFVRKRYGIEQKGDVGALRRAFLGLARP